MSAPLFNADEAGALRHSLSLGLAVSAPKSSHPPVLAQLALLAAWQRCERPVAPDFASVPAAADTHLRYPDIACRGQLARLATMTKKDASSRLLPAALDAIRAAGLALHPFDYARLEDIIARHAERVDSGARAWLQTVRPEKELPEALYDGPAVDESNVAQAGKRQKIAYVAALRVANPAAGRGLVERLFPDEPAANRLELAAVLASHLSGEDRPFLESLASDRAQTVRDKANELLGLLPGTDAFAKRMARLKEDIEIKSEGLLRRRKVLAYKPPANVRPHEVAGAQAALIAGLSLDGIASAFGETADSLITIAAASLKAGPLAYLLFLKAAEEGNLRLVESHPDLMNGDEGTKAVALLQAGLPHLTGPERDRLILFALPVNLWKSLPHGYMFDLIGDAIGGPLPAAVAQPLVASNLWDNVQPNLIEDTAEAVAPLVPLALSARFVARFENAAPRAAQYHKFLSTLPATAV